LAHIKQDEVCDIGARTFQLQLLTTFIAGGKVILVRTSENARWMTVFFGGLDPMTREIKLGGTGFLVVHVEDSYDFGYLVTARHVAKKVRPHGDVVIRVNKKGEDAVNFTVKDIYWAYHTDETVDVAVTPAFINPNEFDVAYYNLADLVRPSDSPYRVQCGDPICIVGLFHWHSGSGRNTPIVHSGNVALLPDPKEMIPIRDRIGGQPQKVEAYLVESQTFEGLSGAPVFQREMVTMGDLFEEHNGGYPIVATGAQLLGVYAGAWEGEPSATLASDRNWGPDKRIPAGMGIVVPGERILEIIMNDPELKKYRAEIHQKRRAKGGT
jgi:hypothetical protein